MPIASSLRRLLRVREIEEEQHKSAMESALADVHQLDATLVSILSRARQGRGLLVQSAQNGDSSDWQAGIEEGRTASDLAILFSERRVSAVIELEEQRSMYLASRTKRRQAETLVEEALIRETRLRSQRDQQALDEWFRSRLDPRKHKDDGKSETPLPL